MELEELRQRWKSIHTGTQQVQQQMWDRVAEDYYARPLPDFSTDPFLQLIEAHCAPKPDWRSLDIGCGAGRYTLALAQRVACSVGVDLSPRMIGFAQRRAASMGAANTRFLCLDWGTADINSLGFSGTFDLVFAHMTPAICDYDTFDRMNACSRHWCILEKHTRRRDKVLDRALEAAGLAGFGASPDDQGLLYAFAYLWLQGYSPQVFYRESVSHWKQPQQAMAAWCLDRARLRQPLDTWQEQAIRAAVEGCAENGQVEETMTSMVATLLWSVQ